MNQESEEPNLENFNPNLFEEIEFIFYLKGNIRSSLDMTKRYVHTLVVNHNDFDGWDGKIAQNIILQEFKNKICNLSKFKEEAKETPIISKFVEWFESELENNIIPSIINEVSPFTVREAISNDNTEIRLLMLSCFNPENIIKELKSDLIDKQTLTKRQRRTTILGSDRKYKTTLPINFKSEQIVLSEKIFEDTYELYRIPKTTNIYPNDQYYVKMKDTTSNKTYYIWIDPSVININKPDVIDAISSTIYTLDFKTLKERRITKEEYLLIKEET